MTGFAVFTAASLACALAPTALTLIGARALQGVGAAILVPNSLALLNHAYPDEQERRRAIGIWAAGASLALTAGLLAGGALISLVGWRSIFLVNLPIGLAGLGLTWRYASETAQSSHRALDLLGQAGAISALACLAGAIIEGGNLGWGNLWALAGFAAFACLAALFVFQERRARQPMLPLSLFSHRLFTLTATVGLLVNVGFYGLIFVLSLYLQRVSGLSPFETGLAFLPLMGAVLPMNLLAARITERFGTTATIAAGALIAAAGCVGLIGIGRGTSYWAMCAQLIALGAGLGLLVPPLTSALLGSVEKARSGIAAGVLNATRQTGSVIGVALFGSLIGHRDALVSGARESVIISTILLVGSALVITLADKSGPPSLTERPSS